MPKSHAHLQTVTKELAKFQIDRYKTVEGLRTHGHHENTPI